MLLTVPRFRNVLALLILCAMLLQWTQISAQATDVGVDTITGTVTVTNPNRLADNNEPIMLLIDLTAFVKRDRTLPLAYPEAVVAAGLQGDLAKGAKFTLQLPIKPHAMLNNVSNGKSKGQGVMVFAVDFNYNNGSVNTIKDGPNVPKLWKGWPGGLDSLAFDSESREVVDGELVVWSPDASEMFPTSYGADGKLFTSDDPVGKIPQGWTVIRLHNGKPFEQIRTATVNVPIIEGVGALVNYSKLSYTEAFDKLVADLKRRYVYSELKHIDWDAIVKEIRPLVEQAEKTRIKDDFNVALEKLAAKFPDGHVSATVSQAYLIKQAIGGLGLVLGQTDDNKVIVINSIANLPGARADIKKGAEIISWNGKPILDALDSTPLFFERASSATTIRLLQLIYITRSAVATQTKITFQNPGATQPRTVTLKSVVETASLNQSVLYGKYDPTELPISSKTLDGGIGYIKINSFETDVIMFAHTWDYVLKQMSEHRVKALIIDVRQNPGGYGQLASYSAGSFVDKSFVLDETYLADKTGKISKVGESTIIPSPTQWTKPVAILIGPACASACEIFSAIMAHDPKHMIVGHYNTAGIEGGVTSWAMPENLKFYATVVRFQNPDGSVFLEGTGVPPTVKVPVTVESLLSTDDDVLAAAKKALQSAK